ncbi:MAG: EamA family transporter [Candidatus Odinarchaeia archaeon]
MFESYLGFILAIFSAFLFGLGTSLQKKGLNIMEPLFFKTFIKKIHRVFISLILNKFWILGTLISISGWYLYVNALSLTDLIIVRPIINLNIVFVIIIGVLTLNERINKRELIGMILIISGVLFLSLVSERTGSIDYNPSYLILSIAVCISLSLFTLAMSRFKSEKISMIYSVAAGLTYGVSEIFNKLLAFQSISLLDPLSLVVIFVNPMFWLLAILTLLAFILKQTALSQGRSSVTIPVITAFSVTIPILLSLTIFGELLVIPIEGVLIFPISFFRVIGLFLALLGTIVVTLYYTPILQRKILGDEQKTYVNSC